ncbi:MAG: Stressosome protein rsbRB [Bacillota bacterium]|nr:Stressosome protein rsbRB [Bacillota bacterium]
MQPYLKPFQGDTSLEVNMRGKDKLFLLCDVHLSWENKIATIIFIPKDGKVQVLEEKLVALKQRLASTDFELFEKKEALELAVKELNALSGPFLPISDKMAFVPLFGDITEEKMETITHHVLDAVNEGEYDEILFDLSATGNIEKQGLLKLKQLFSMIQYMNGNQVKLMGVKPSHARKLNEFAGDFNIQSERSLKAVLKKNRP